MQVDTDAGTSAIIHKSGQVLTMQVDVDAGTLKFWVDGKPHGSGYNSGVTGPLSWATTVVRIGNIAEIVPTMELQPWTPWEPPEEDSDY